jgi:hypothetical protein
MTSMDFGLSDRMALAMEELHAGSVEHPTGSSEPGESIDLSNAQNEVLRPELVEFFKTTVEDKLTGKVREDQHAKHSC